VSSSCRHEDRRLAVLPAVFFVSDDLLLMPAQEATGFRWRIREGIVRVNFPRESLIQRSHVGSNQTDIKNHDSAAKRHDAAWFLLVGHAVVFLRASTSQKSDDDGSRAPEKRGTTRLVGETKGIVSA